jgi:hypothetical protein
MICQNQGVFVNRLCYVVMHVYASRAAPPPRRATKKSLTSLMPARSDRIPTQCTPLPRWSPASLLEITQLSSCSLASDTCHYARRNHARLSLPHYSCLQSRRSLPATSLVCQASISSRRHPPRYSHHSSPDSAPPNGANLRTIPPPLSQASRTSAGLIPKQSPCPRSSEA